MLPHDAGTSPVENSHKQALSAVDSDVLQAFGGLADATRSLSQAEPRPARGSGLSDR
jgi:hypothetical protein